jgi:4-diphosphocytidyl-2-C-methyl-D-erythritol kinase
MMLARAKLNLWLHVMAKEESGYHSIETLFHRIELADDVVVTLAPAGVRTVTCSVDVGPATQNLAYRAAQIYCETVDWPAGFHIDITKRIPARGGLGGGSADAAATLLALNEMSPRRCSKDELSAIGSRLGSDVPFLLTGSPRALAWGRGDRMLLLPALPRRHVALVIPSFGISTADAYRSLPDGRTRTRAQLIEGDLANWDAVAGLAQNDLADSAVVRAHPEIENAVRVLRAAGASMADMTGSGSVVFGIFESRPDASALGRATGGQVLLTQTTLNVEAPSRLD